MNQYNLLYNNVPFGGKKQSGIGKWILFLGPDNHPKKIKIPIRVRTPWAFDSKTKPLEWDCLTCGTIRTFLISRFYPGVESFPSPKGRGP